MLLDYINIDVMSRWHQKKTKLLASYFTNGFLFGVVSFIIYPLAKLQNIKSYSGFLTLSRYLFLQISVTVIFPIVNHKK